MNAVTLCTALQQAVPPPFECSPAPQEGVRVRTPMLYPDGDVVDVFVLERNDGYIVTDFGDALGWLGLQSVAQRRSPKQNALIQDVCQTLRIEIDRDQLMLRGVASGALGESVLRVAQAAVRVSDLWFTLRSQATQSTADEVGEGPIKQGKEPNKTFVDRVLLAYLELGGRADNRKVVHHIVAKWGRDRREVHRALTTGNNAAQQQLKSRGLLVNDPKIHAHAGQPGVWLLTKSGWDAARELAGQQGA